MKKSILFALILLFVFPVEAKKTIIKIATLAPEGSEWHGILLEMAQRWEIATGGAVKTRIYPGGVVGDERDMIRKMRIGQIHASAITAEGLSEINPDFYAFYIPLLFEDYEDVDFIRERILDDLRKGVEENGFRLLLIADVGWAYWFTREPVIYPEDLRKLRIFTWAGDFKSAELWKKGGFHPVPLASIDVLSGLQTGLIDAISANPLFALTQQWFGVVNYMLDMKWGLLTGGVVIDKRVFNRIKPEHQKIMLEIAREIETIFQTRNRYEGDKAIDVMKTYGLKVHHQTLEEKEHWKNYILDWYPYLRGDYLSEKMFDQIIQLKEEKDSLEKSKP